MVSSLTVGNGCVPVTRPDFHLKHGMLHHPLQFLQTGCQYDLVDPLLKPFKPYDQAPHVVVLDSNWFGILLQHLGK
jgi:hypothetical protein